MTVRSFSDKTAKGWKCVTKYKIFIFSLLKESFILTWLLLVYWHMLILSFSHVIHPVKKIFIFVCNMHVPFVRKLNFTIKIRPYSVYHKQATNLQHVLFIWIQCDFNEIWQRNSVTDSAIATSAWYYSSLGLFYVRPVTKALLKFVLFYLWYFQSVLWWYRLSSLVVLCLLCGIVRWDFLEFSSKLVRRCY